MPKLNNGGNKETSHNKTALFQNMTEGMLLQDRTGRIIEFNQAALDILGITEEQVDSINNLDSELPENIFPGKNHIGMNSFKTGKTQRNIILNIFTLAGEIRWISLNCVPLFFENNDVPDQLLNTFTDITETKKALSDLKQIQLLFDISHDLVIIANFEGYFKKINPRFQEILGYRLSEILSQKFLNFVHPEDLELTQRELKKIIELKESVHFINRYKAKNGEYRVFDWVVVPGQEENIIFFTARDITDYRAEELDLIHSSKVYSIGEMTSGIAYIIHVQLAVIGGHISFIQDQLDKGSIEPRELKNKIQSIEESIQRLAKTTKELTSFARNTDNEQLSDVSLSRILESVLDLCKERFRIHGVKLGVQIEDDPVIHCRESQIAHLFITLLNHAYDEVHSDRDSWVELIGKIEHDLIRISISDSSRKVREQNAKPFNIPQVIIEENFGVIYFDNTNPHTKFILEFPLVKKELESEF